MKSKKLKKILFIFILNLIGLISLSVFNSVQAADGSMYLTLSALRESGFGYQYKNKYVWKIVETNSEGTTSIFDKTIYCLRAGVGFGSNVWASGDPVQRQYTKYFDMKNLEDIDSQYAEVLPSGDNYYAVLWILEHAYIPELPDAAIYRSELLSAAGIKNNYLTDDDIDVVQQLAIWHFTNTDTEYDVGEDGNFELYINKIKDVDGNYNGLSDEERRRSN